MRASESIRWYSRPEVAKELIRVSQDREVGVRYQDGHFGKRPSVLLFPDDLKTLAREGATSFHISEELWQDPMRLSPNSTERDLLELRKGWDLIIDIDCPWFEYSTITAKVLIEALRFHGIKNPAVKFSGSKGWHIGLPFSSLPDKVGRRDSETLFPEATLIVIAYLKEFIADILFEKIKEYEGDIKKIVEKTGKKREEFISGSSTNVFSLIDLDLQLGAPRHLIRAPYSFHEKTSLISLPILTEELDSFKREQAKPQNIKEIRPLFFSEETTPGEATQLIIQAFDWHERLTEKEVKQKKVYTIEGQLPKQFFPPCVKLVLKGLPDGRKRSLFMLINFFRGVNWSWEQIEQELEEWNKKNNPPLKAGYFRGQLNWHRRQRARFPPPNCRDFYRDIGICRPDNLCGKIRNPLSYAGRKSRFKK